MSQPTHEVGWFAWFRAMHASMLMIYGLKMLEKYPYKIYGLLFCDLKGQFMNLRHFSSARMLVLVCIAGLSACAGPKYAFQKENFEAKGPFDHHFNASKQVVYQAMKRVALRQGFAIERDSEPDSAIVVSKQYQEGNLNTLLTLSGLVMGGGKTADAWIAAQEVALKSNEARQTASVGLGLGLSIPIPTGTTTTLTKERGETVMDKVFYEKIYAAIDREIPLVSEQLATSSIEDDSRLRAEIEKKLRIEMEVRAKLEKEAHELAAANATLPTSAPVISSAAPVPSSKL